jgi:bifunctional DNase/RNase
MVHGENACEGEAGMKERGPFDSALLSLREISATLRMTGFKKLYGPVGGLAEAAMEIEMKIRGLMMDPVTQLPIVILKDVDSETLLPIWVGVFEANAIALEIEKVATPRPMTHDLIRNVLSGLDTFVHRVVVTELRADTFYAVIWLERNGKIISVDSRPSDALALALRADCPIYVDEEVIRTSKSSNAESERLSNDELKKFLEGLNDEDLGKYKM